MYMYMSVHKLCDSVGRKICKNEENMKNRKNIFMQDCGTCDLMNIHTIRRNFYQINAYAKIVNDQVLRDCH